MMTDVIIVTILNPKFQVQSVHTLFDDLTFIRLGVTKTWKFSSPQDKNSKWGSKGLWQCWVQLSPSHRTGDTRIHDTVARTQWSTSVHTPGLSLSHTPCHSASGRSPSTSPHSSDTVWKNLNFTYWKLFTFVSNTVLHLVSVNSLQSFL